MSLVQLGRGTTVPPNMPRDHGLEVNNGMSPIFKDCNAFIITRQTVYTLKSYTCKKRQQARLPWHPFAIP